MWEAQFLVLLLLQLQRVAPGKMGLTLWEGCPPDPRGWGVVSRGFWTSRMPRSLASVDSSKALLGVVFLPQSLSMVFPLGGEGAAQCLLQPCFSFR